MKIPLMSTAYWPNLHYFFYVLNAETIHIEQFEHYPKQSFRNRTRILTANGVLDLSIPVKKISLKEYTKDVQISYAENWQIKHWRAITSAYKNSPYFEYFEDDLFYFYKQPFETLIDYNLQQLNVILKLLQLKKNIILSKAYEKQPFQLHDVRELIHPKLDFKTDPLASTLLAKKYYQTFETKFDFRPNLSIIDLLFNCGLKARAYFNE